MADITIDPTEFILVKYETPDIIAIAQRIASGVGFPDDFPVRINIEESTPLTRVLIGTLTPLVLEVEGGAFEDPKRPRHLSVTNTGTALARVLFQAHDRLFGGFAGVGLTGVSLEQQIAWDVTSYGRAERLGLTVPKQPRLYAFRNRHGFSDSADAVFDRLWNTDTLTWSDLVAVCEETAQVR